MQCAAVNVSPGISPCSLESVTLRPEAKGSKAGPAMDIWVKKKKKHYTLPLIG